MTCLMATPSSEVAQTLASATSKRGLNREERAALLRVRTSSLHYSNVRNMVPFAVYIGEGNCNPLQCSCLDNPMDGGAW